MKGYELSVPPADGDCGKAEARVEELGRVVPRTADPNRTIFFGARPAPECPRGRPDPARPLSASFWSSLFIAIPRLSLEFENYLRSNGQGSDGACCRES